MLCRCGKHHFTYISYLCCSLEPFLQSFSKSCKRGFFFLLFCRQALLLICFSWAVDLSLKMLVWGRAFTCPRAISLLLALLALTPAWLWLVQEGERQWHSSWSHLSEIQDGNYSFIIFSEKSLNQCLTLQGAGQQEMDSAKAMHTMCKG